MELKRKIHMRLLVLRSLCVVRVNIWQKGGCVRQIPWFRMFNHVVWFAIVSRVRNINTRTYHLLFDLIFNKLKEKYLLDIILPVLLGLGVFSGYYFWPWYLKVTKVSFGGLSLIKKRYCSLRDQLKKCF